jgi:magnesium-transporting ATPase (P-type)
VQSLHVFLHSVLTYHLTSTGTLTENRMTVVEGWFCGKSWSSLPTRDALSSDVLELLNANCSMNSKAFLVEKPDSPVIDFVGNRTECALLVLLKKLGFDYNATREARGPDQIKVRSFFVLANRYLGSGWLTICVSMIHIVIKLAAYLPLYAVVRLFVCP